MPSDKAELLKLVNFSYTEFDGNHRFSVVNNVTAELAFVGELLYILGNAFLYVGVVFAIFSALMLSNFIGISIAYKKQEIGILRAIGARSSDVFKIFFAESFIIAMINYLLSIIGTLAFTGLINNLMRGGVGLLVTVLDFGIRQIVLLLIISLATSLIATFIPVKKIAAMKPIDAIKNRK